MEKGRDIGIRDVANATGVSIATVSNALRGTGRMSDDTRRRVLEAAAQLAFHPKRRGPRAGTRRAKFLLLIEAFSLHPEQDVFVGAIIKGISRATDVRGADLLIHVVEPEMVRENRVPQELYNSQIKGVIILAGGDLSDTYIDTVAQAGLPTILVDNVCYKRSLHCITADNVTGAYLVTKHLIDLGHRRLGILKGPQKYKPLVERYLGFLQALEAHGIPFDPMFAIPPIAGETVKGYGQMHTLLSQPNRPTAVFAISDKTALGALQAASDMGVRIPDDVAVVGFDDIAEAAVHQPSLTTVAVPREELGRLAAEKLFDLCDFPGQPPIRLTVPVQVVVRESSRMGAR